MIASKHLLSIDRYSIIPSRELSLYTLGYLVIPELFYKMFHGKRRRRKRRRRKRRREKQELSRFRRLACNLSSFDYLAPFQI